MFNIIVETLSSLGHSPERENQQETEVGCIYEENSPFVWYFDGSLWRCRPENSKAVVEVFHDGVWIKNSLIEHVDQAIEFAEELAADWLDQILLSLIQDEDF